MRNDIFRLTALAAAAVISACTVDLMDPPNRKCDATHMCRTGQVCGADGVCADIGSTGGGGGSAGGSAGGGGGDLGGGMGGGAMGGGTGIGGGSDMGGGMGGGAMGGGMAMGGGATGGGATGGGATGGGATGGGATGGGATGGGATGGGTGMGGGATGGGGMMDAGSDAGFDAGIDMDAGNPPTYFVDTGGNDTNPGTLAFPWKTVAKVNTTTMPPGSTVLFHGGQSWNESLVPSCSGDAGAAITFSSFGAGDAILDGTGKAFNGIQVQSHSYLKFSKLEVRNDKPGACVHLQSVDHLTFDTLNVHDCGEGFQAAGGVPCDNVTLTNSTVQLFAPTTDGGTGNGNALSLSATCNSWVVSDSTVAQSSASCVSDQSGASTFARLNVNHCAGTALNLGGTGTRVESNQISASGTGVRFAASAAGAQVVRRNRIWDSDKGVSMDPGTAVDLRISNNSVLGGRVGGGMSTTGYELHSATALAVENNLGTGSMMTALSVTGVTNATLADGGVGAPNGYLDRSNVFDTSSGQVLSWDMTAVTPDQYQVVAGDAGTIFDNPLLTSTMASSPNFTLQAASPAIDIGVSDPASGTLFPGCDGGVDSYCRAAPDPGAAELP